MKGPGWIFQCDRERRFLSHSLALDQNLVGRLSRQ
jgi:hypothetical protein